MWPALDPSLGLAVCDDGEFPGEHRDQPGDDRWGDVDRRDQHEERSQSRGASRASTTTSWDYRLPDAGRCSSRPTSAASPRMDGRVTRAKATTTSNRPSDRKPLLPVKEVPVRRAQRGGHLILPRRSTSRRLRRSRSRPATARSYRTARVPRSPGPGSDGRKYVYSCTYAAPGSTGASRVGDQASSAAGLDASLLQPEARVRLLLREVSVEAAKIGSVKKAALPQACTRAGLAASAAVN